MKRILLTSTALVAFAGAAAAEVTFGGDAKIGHNDKFKKGFFYSFGLTMTLDQQLNNGWNAKVSGDVVIDNAHENGASTSSGGKVTVDDLELSLTSDSYGVHFGDTDSAVDSLWKGAVTNMEHASFLGKDDADDGGEVDAILRGQMIFGPATVAISSFITDAEGGSARDTAATQIVASFDLLSVKVGLAFQEKDITLDHDKADGDEGAEGVMGLTASTTLGGADLALSHTRIDTLSGTGDGSSTGIQVGYPVGDVTLTAFYVSNNSDDNTIKDDNYGLKVAYSAGALKVNAHMHDGHDEETAIDIDYDIGNGMKVNAGWVDSDGDEYNENDGSYIGMTYDLGGEATLSVSYVSDGDKDRTSDKIGADGLLADDIDMKDGATVSVSFEF